MKLKYNQLLSITVLVTGIYLQNINAQITEGENGLYYDGSGKLFSGIYTEKYDDGTVKTQMSVTNGRKNGLTVIFFPNGKKNELRMYKNNLLHGTWETWNQQGQKTAEANYANDKKNGKWYVWDDNGVMRYDMTYFEGEKAGTWSMWNSKGELTGQKEYSLNPNVVIEIPPSSEDKP